MDKNIYSNRYFESKRKHSTKYNIWSAQKENLAKTTPNSNLHIKNCQPIKPLNNNNY